MSLAAHVYRRLCEVPRGRVTTYGELARAVGLPNGQRAIGRLMAENPYPGVVPCHRVVRSDGRLGGYRYGAESKTAMLDREGIGVDRDKVADFERIVFRFSPP